MDKNARIATAKALSSDLKSPSAKVMSLILQTFMEHDIRPNDAYAGLALLIAIEEQYHPEFTRTFSELLTQARTAVDRGGKDVVIV